MWSPTPAPASPPVNGYQPPWKIPLREAAAGDIRAVADVLADGFGRDPSVALMFPDPGRRVRALTALFEVQVDHARQHGTVLIAGQDQGVAVVLAPDYDPSAAEIGALRRRMARACAADASTALGYLDALEAEHPHRRPHHYLTLLAVRAALQGHGIGSALLSDLTGRWQAVQEPAYLEATTPAGRRLYRRHGFTDHGTLLHPLSGPAVHPMWRNPTT